MLEYLKKKSFKASLTLSIVLLLIGAVIIAIFAKDIKPSATGYVDFSTLEPDEIHSGTLVEVDVKEAFGCFSEYYEENTTTHVKKTTHLYYVIWTGTDESVDYRFMAIKVPAKYESQLETITENTFNGIANTNPLHMTGRIKGMSSEEMKYFKKYGFFDGLEASEFGDYTLPYVIDATATSAGAQKFLTLAAVAVGALLIVFAIYRTIKAAKGGYLKKFTKKYEDAGYSQSTIESDFRNAKTFDKVNNFSMGSLCMYDLSGTLPTIVINKDLCWAYLHTTTHRTNGIKTGTTYEVRLHSKDGKGYESVPVKKEYMAIEILEVIAKRFPWVIVGYTEEFNRMYNKQLSQFLSLRYNTTEHVEATQTAAPFTPYDPFQ